MTVEAMELPTDTFSVGKAEDEKIEEKRAVSGISEEAQLKIDPEIQDLCPPLDKEAYALLKRDLQENGCRDPIIYWEGQVSIQGVKHDQALSGQGYVELTGYAGSLGGRF